MPILCRRHQYLRLRHQPHCAYGGTASCGRLTPGGGISRTLGSRSAGSVAHPCAQRLWMPVLMQRPLLICVDPAKKCSVNFRPFSVGKERSEFGNEFRVSIKSHTSSHQLFFAAEVWDGRAARFCRVGWGSGLLMRYLFKFNCYGKWDCPCEVLVKVKNAKYVV